MTLPKAVVSMTAAVLLATGTTASAHNYSNNECNIELNGNLKYANASLTITLDSGDQVEFTPLGDVYLEGDRLSLTTEQSAMAEQYYQSIHEAVPTTIEVAREAVDMANTAIPRCIFCMSTSFATL